MRLRSPDDPHDGVPDMCGGALLHDPMGDLEGTALHRNNTTGGIHRIHCTHDGAGGLVIPFCMSIIEIV